MENSDASPPQKINYQQWLEIGIQNNWIDPPKPTPQEINKHLQETNLTLDLNQTKK